MRLISTVITSRIFLGSGNKLGFFIHFVGYITNMATFKAEALNGSHFFNILETMIVCGLYLYILIHRVHSEC